MCSEGFETTFANEIRWELTFVRPSAMNAANLRQALTQTLESFKRCGIARFGTQHEFSPEAISNLEQWLAAEQSDSAQDSVSVGATGTDTGTSHDRNVGLKEPISGQAPSPAPLSSGGGAAGIVASGDAAAGHGAAVGAASGDQAAPAPVNSSSLAPPTGPWSLPVLDIAERQSEFAQLDARIKACRRCTNIVDFRHQTVFGVGEIKPRLCFMGEAPGADEDRLGEPFVGRAGQLLNKIIGAMKLRREEVYILNALKCRPPQNRTPLPEEIANCNEFVERQLEVLQPEYIVCLGAVAVRALLGSSSSIGRLRGRFHEYKSARVVVTYHPSYLLRQESAKRLVWEDMKMLLADMGIEL